jgi:cob(I)alamin adenosyltransferase
MGVAYEQFKPLHPFFANYSPENLEDLKQHFSLFWEEQMTDVKNNTYDLLVIDEMGPALAYKIMPEETILKFLEEKPETLELIMTGRNFPSNVLEKADYLTEMKLIKHPYQRGVNARRGIEF